VVAVPGIRVIQGDLILAGLVAPADLVDLVAPAGLAGLVDLVAPAGLAGLVDLVGLVGPAIREVAPSPMTASARIRVRAAAAVCVASSAVVSFRSSSA
jgi:hypothetical protein